MIIAKKNVHNNAVLFFKTTMVDPAFKKYLDYADGHDNKKNICFVKHFQGDKTDSKFNELNAALSYFVLKVRKRKPRKKDVGKPPLQDT